MSGSGEFLKRNRVGKVGLSGGLPIVATLYSLLAEMAMFHQVSHTDRGARYFRNMK